MPPGINGQPNQRGGFSGPRRYPDHVTAPGPGGATDAPSALRAEFDRRKAEIQAMADAVDAARAAGQLVDETTAFPAEAGQLRTETFETLRAENLKLHEIAERLGLALPTVQKVLEREKRAARARERKQAARKADKPRSDS